MRQSVPRYEVGAGRPAAELPLALCDLHLSLGVGEKIVCSLKPTIGNEWTPQLAADLVIGAGFISINSIIAKSGEITFELIRIRSLPDIVSANMSLLIVGLNPSLYSADQSISYARPGNRFWPAVLAAKIVSKDRDPKHALYCHGVGMTDLVRRATRRAAELGQEEVTSGFTRIERQIAWLRPKVVCFMGLGGWRAVAGKKATAGIQAQTLGNRPVYLMPNPSGLNAHCRLEDFVKHFRKVAQFVKHI